MTATDDRETGGHVPPVDPDRVAAMLAPDPAARMAPVPGYAVAGLPVPADGAGLARECADAYAAMLAADADPDAAARRAWGELAAASRIDAAHVRARLAVRETDDPEPYPDAAAMLADIARGRFTVSRANSDHPLWSRADNVAFRIAHDVGGHAASGGDFSWRGENLACSAHAPRLNRPARLALVAECLCQTGYAIAAGGFGPQRCAVTPAVREILAGYGWDRR